LPLLDSSRPAFRVSFLLVVLLAAVALSSNLSGSTAPKNLGRAIEAQRALVAERPGDSAVQNDLGSLLVLAEDLEGAGEAYRAAIGLDGTNAAAHFNLGLLLQRLGERRTALKEFKRTIDLEPRNAWAHYQAGTIYDHWGVDSLARRAYARALAIDPALANPEVNPHFIDNELATSAMLYSYHHYRDELLPEKRFEEPARIAGVLIDRPHADADAVANHGAAAPTGGGFVRSTGTAGGSVEAIGEEKVEPSDGDEGASRVLSSKDLDPGRNTNQVGGGAGTVVGGRATVGARTSRTRDPKGTTAPVRPVLRGPNSPANPNAPPPSMAPVPQTFLPTGDSTGRMETQLLEIDALG
jgi:tetratricopeptide (TPR) repeat protein